MARFYFDGTTYKDFVALRNGNDKAIIKILPRKWYPMHDAQTYVKLFEVAPNNPTHDSHSFSFQDTECAWASCEPFACGDSDPIGDKLNTLAKIFEERNFNNYSVINSSGGAESIGAGAAHKVTVLCLTNTVIVTDAAASQIRLNAGQSITIEADMYIQKEISIDTTTYSGEASIIVIS